MKKRKKAKDISPVMAFPYSQVVPMILTKHNELEKLVQEHKGLLAPDHQPIPENDIVIKFMSLTVEFRTVIEAIEKVSDDDLLAMRLDPNVARNQLIPTARKEISTYQEAIKDLAFIPGGVGIPDEIPFFGNTTSNY